MGVGGWGSAKSWDTRFGNWGKLELKSYGSEVTLIKNEREAAEKSQRNLFRGFGVMFYR